MRYYWRNIRKTDIFVSPWAIWTAINTANPDHRGYASQLLARCHGGVVTIATKATWRCKASTIRLVLRPILMGQMATEVGTFLLFFFFYWCSADPWKPCEKGSEGPKTGLSSHPLPSFTFNKWFDFLLRDTNHVHFRKLCENHCNISHDGRFHQTLSYLLFTVVERAMANLPSLQSWRKIFEKWVFVALSSIATAE